MAWAVKRGEVKIEEEPQVQRAVLLVCSRKPI